MTRPLVRLVVVAAAVCGAVLGMTATMVLTQPGEPGMTDVAVAREQATVRATEGGPAGGAITDGEPTDGEPTAGQPTGGSGPSTSPLAGPAAPSPDRPGSPGVPPPAPAVPPSTGPGGPAAPPPPSPGSERVLLVWTAGGLPAGLAQAAATDPAIRAWSSVAGDQAGLVAVRDPDGATLLSLDDGWQVPLDVLAVDPAAHAPFVAGLGTADDRRAVEALAPGEALLSRTSAALRGVGEGAEVTLVDGASLRVAGVIDDRAASGAELVVHAADARRLGLDTPRFLLLAHTGPRAAVQARLVEVVGSTPVRFRTPAETTWLRHGDAVLPQMILKEAFGEFPVRLVAGRDVEVELSWEAAHIVTDEVAILGEVRCHRELLPRLAGAMAELSRRNLAHLIDRDAFAGCYVPRRIAPGESLSRHAWGVALDINVGENPRGSFSTQDPRLVEVMRAHGFTWGGTWLVPDPAHYEVVATGEW